MYDKSVIAKTGLETCIFNLMLPSGSILSLGNVTSVRGLGGYHGLVHLNRDGKKITLYYSANVHSERSAAGEENGVGVFDASWKNVVATLYHHMNEYRTDADVSDAIEHGNSDFLGWNSRRGKEVGDQPIFKAGEAGDLNLCSSKSRHRLERSFRSVSVLKCGAWCRGIPQQPTRLS